MATVEDVLAAMERVVSAATPGPWSRCCRACNVLEHGEDRERLGNTFYNGHTVYAVRDGSFISEEEADANADYIARFDPPTLTALLAVVRAASSIDSIQIMDGNLIGDWVGIPKASFNKIMDALDALTRPPQALTEGPR